MATGHLNPGYGNIVTTLQRARAAQLSQFDTDGQNLKSLQGAPGVSNLDLIRQQAKNAWLAKDNNETSYQHHFENKFVKVQEFQQTRPSSSCRKNKPHPTM